MPGGMRIRNVSGTTATKCGCRTWKRHWMNEIGRPWPKSCGVYGCSNTADVGAHVRFDDRRTGNHWYILPMCNHHNSLKSNLSDERMDKRFCVAWARKSKTCGQ